MTATRRYLAAALLLCAVASTAAGSVFAGEDASTDRTLLRMGDGARRLTDRIVERPIPLEGLLADVDGTPPTPFEHSSGYFKLNRTKAAEMFYFYFKSRSATPSKDPVVLWMTGGPGCSSELAVFYENGPYHITPDLKLEVTEHGWDTVSNLVYVDQPINTGFSYSDDPADEVHDESVVAEDMLQFLAEFVQAHPELDGNDFFITGESYAGHYVPAVSYRVFRAAQTGEFTGLKLKGLAVGNGLTMPEIQYGAYADYALAHDMVGSVAAAAARTVYPACRAAIKKCGGGVAPDGPEPEPRSKKATCLTAVEICQTIPSGLMAVAGDVNIYDVHKKNAGPSFPYDFSDAEKFLNDPSVRAALGVGDRKWEMCSGKVHEDMMADWMRNLEPTIPPMLEGGVRVMIYAGENDFICNWLGNHRWVKAMEWSGKAGFNAAMPTPFVVDGTTGGDVTEHGLLSFVKMSESGHMVPMDQPRNAVEMLRRFISGEAIAGGEWNPPAIETRSDAVRVGSRAGPRRAMPTA